MQLLPAPLEQAFVGGIAHQGVLEDIGSGRREAPPENKLCRYQAVKRRGELHLWHRHDRSKQLVIELAANTGSDLGHLLDRSKTVKPRHQRIVQRRRDRHGRDWPGEHVASAGVAEDPGFKHGLREFLGEKRHTLGPRQDLAEDLGGKRFAFGDAVDEYNHLRLWQAV